MLDFILEVVPDKQAYEPKHEGMIRLFELRIDDAIDLLLGQWDIGYEELLDHLHRRYLGERDLLANIKDAVRDM